MTKTSSLTFLTALLGFALVNAPVTESSAQTTTATVCGPMTGPACEVVKRVNYQRRLKGIKNLRANQNCIDMAESHADDMVANSYFSHTSPSEGSFSERTTKFDVTGYRGENIAYGLPPAQTVSAWMNSAGHRANILNSKYISTGVGVKTNLNGRTYYVQCFTSASPTW
jgi:uncharacterized protein YkwD